MKLIRRILFSKEEVFVLLRSAIMLAIGLVFYNLSKVVRADNTISRDMVKYFIGIILMVTAVINILLNDSFKNTKKIFNGIKALINRAVSIAKRIGEIFIIRRLNYSRNSSNISGFTDTFSKIGKEKKQDHFSKVKYKKWSKMDEIEKIRFIYYKATSRFIKKGYEYKQSFTANENYESLKDKKFIKDDVSLFFKEYNKARYTEKISIDKEEIESFRKKMSVNK